MQSIIVKGIVAVAAISVAACSSPREEDSDLNIRGGTWVNDQGSSPYNHVVMLGMGSSMSCSGTMIGPDLILTATHCLQGKAVGHFNVFFGTNIATAKKTKVLDHRMGYLPSLSHFGGMDLPDVPKDYALLKIGATARGMRAAPLHGQTLAKNTVVKQVGFGTNDLNQVGRLKENDARVKRPGNAVQGLIVTSTSGTIGSGDSGGPLFVKSGGGWAVAGITSACFRGQNPHCITGTENYYVPIPHILPTLRNWAMAMTGRPNPFAPMNGAPRGTGSEPPAVEECGPLNPCGAAPAPVPSAGEAEPEEVDPDGPRELPKPPAPQCTIATPTNWMQFRDNPEPGCVWCIMDRGRGFHLTAEECTDGDGHIQKRNRGVPRSVDGQSLTCTKATPTNWQSLMNAPEAGCVWCVIGPGRDIHSTAAECSAAGGTPQNTVSEPVGVPRGTEMVETQSLSCTAATPFNWTALRDAPEPGCVWCAIGPGRDIHSTAAECSAAGGTPQNTVSEPVGVPRGTEMVEARSLSCTAATPFNWTALRDAPEPGCVWCVIGPGRDIHSTAAECSAAGGKAAL